MKWSEEKKIIKKGLACILLLILIAEIFLVCQLIKGTARDENGGFIWELYDFYSESYQDNPIILHMSNFCNQFEDKVPCVYKTVPYEYHNSPHYFVSPEEYWKNGGVCRDRVIILNSIMNNLNISCSYIFSPDYVYLTCSENGNLYILDNTLEVIENEK